MISTLACWLTSRFMGIPAPAIDQRSIVSDRGWPSADELDADGLVLALQGRGETDTGSLGGGARKAHSPNFSFWMVGPAWPMIGEGPRDRAARPVPEKAAVPSAGR